jgi:hypothetical protein
MFEKMSCDSQNETWLAKMVSYMNDRYKELQNDDIYGDEVINWAFINSVVPPFFCCAARAAYEGSL